MVMYATCDEWTNEITNECIQWNTFRNDKVILYAKMIDFRFMSW